MKALSTSLFTSLKFPSISKKEEKWKECNWKRKKSDPIPGPKTKGRSTPPEKKILGEKWKSSLKAASQESNMNVYFPMMTIGLFYREIREWR